MFPDDYDLTSVVERWSAAVSRPERLHLVQVDPDRPTEAWHSFGKVIGFDTRGLELPDADRVPATDPAGLRSVATPEPRVRASEAMRAMASGASAPRDRLGGHDDGEARERSERRRGPGPKLARVHQCGCQASSSAVRDVTALGSLPSESCWIETCSNTSRSECRAAIHTCWSTSAVSL